MSMVCPQCGTSHEQRLQCPACGTRLLYHDPRRRYRGSGHRWHQSPWGRILLGLLLAQGLFYSLRHLLTGVLMAVHGEAALQERAATVYGLLLFQALQVLPLMLGAILAGSGQREGIFLGTMVGMFNGVLSVLVRSGPVQELTTVAVYGQPLVQTAFGALAGWIGCTVWKPLPTATVPGGSRLVRKKPVRRKVSLFAGRVAWVRVAAGAALAVIGSLSATIILEIVLAAAAASNSNTRVSYGSDFVALQQMQDQIVTWEIKALAVLVGGAVAGSNTHNGLKQGLCVGVASGSMLVISLGVTHRAAFDVAGLTLISVLSLSLVGGWFGSQLLPPVVPVKRLRGLGPEA